MGSSSSKPTPVTDFSIYGNRVDNMRKLSPEYKERQASNKLSKPKEKTKANNPTKINTGLNIGGKD